MPRDIDPYRDSSHSLAARLAEVERERDELAEALRRERDDRMPTTNAYLRALLAIALAGMAGFMLASLEAPAVVVALHVGFAMWVLRPVLRTMKVRRSLPVLDRRHEQRIDSAARALRSAGFSADEVESALRRLLARDAWTPPAAPSTNVRPLNVPHPHAPLVDGCVPVVPVPPSSNPCTPPSHDRTGG